MVEKINTIRKLNIPWNGLAVPSVLFSANFFVGSSTSESIQGNPVFSCRGSTSPSPTLQQDQAGHDPSVDFPVSRPFCLDSIQQSWWGEWAGCLRVALAAQGSKLGVCNAVQASLKKMCLFLPQGYPGGK